MAGQPVCLHHAGLQSVSPAGAGRRGGDLT